MLIQKYGKSEEVAQEIAIALVGAYAKQMDRRNPEQSAVLIFISEDEIESICAQLNAQWDELIAAGNNADDKARDKERDKIFKDIVAAMVKAYRDRVAAPDIALFGRMLASEPKLNLEAACQVAHAISTHRVSMEMDYFTAVDDVREANEETGAGHINTFGFNSSCFYRYARIDWQQLVDNLGGDKGLARRAVEGFLRASLIAVPSGKQNSTAPLNPASFILSVVRRDGMGWNLANAFEKPVTVQTGRNSSIVTESIAALDRYWGKLEAVYGNDTLAKVASLNLDGESLAHLNGERSIANQEAWLEATLAALEPAETGQTS